MSSNPSRDAEDADVAHALANYWRMRGVDYVTGERENAEKRAAAVLVERLGITQVAARELAKDILR